MISEAEVRELVGDYLDGCTVDISRSGCGWPTACGWRIAILSEIPGNQHTTYIRDDMSSHQAWSIITNLATNALNFVE
jgi:hypothetical protein